LRNHAAFRGDRGSDQLPAARPLGWRRRPDRWGWGAGRARHLGLDAEAAWQTSEVLTNTLARVQPLVRIRPRAFASAWPGGNTALIAVKGVCCLYFNMHDRDEDRWYCANCPNVGDQSRSPGIEATLAREYDPLARDRAGLPAATPAPTTATATRMS
jgi:hypothetical protein